MRRGREGGFALILVLWSMAMIALIGARVTASGGGEARIARNALDRAILEQAADGAVHDAMFHLAGGTWTWRTAPTEIRIGRVAVAIRLADEGGRVNLNQAPRGLIEALLLAIGLPSGRAATLAEAIAAWRSPGDGMRGHRSKNALYAAAGLPYGPREGPFRSTGEIGLVLGMDPDTLARLRPHVTLFTDGDVDRELADDAVRTALGRFGRNVLPADVVLGQISTVVHVTATATAPDGAHVTRDASLRLSRIADQDDRLIEVMSWGTGADAPTANAAGGSPAAARSTMRR